MFNPRISNSLPALEKNILKYRAIEAALILFYAENLKSKIINSVLETEKFRDKEVNTAQRLTDNTKQKFKVALDILVYDKIFTEDEAKEIKTLIDYRNIIAHRIFTLNSDVEWSWNSRQLVESTNYNPKARKRLKYYHSIIFERLRGKFIIVLDMALFIASEKAYIEELKKLQKRIFKQNKIRKKEKIQMHTELISFNNLDKSDISYLYEPTNKYENGRLTKQGISAFYKLFETGRGVFTVSYIMEISFRSACFHMNNWKKQKCID